MRRERSLADFAFDSVNILLMIFLMLITGYPLLYLFFVSLSGNLVGNQLLFLPKGFSLGYYINVLNDISILRSFYVSAVRTIAGPLSMLFVTSLCGYVMSDKDYVFRKFFWRYFLIPMFIGGGLIPTYLLMKGLGLTNSFWVYIIPGLYGGTFTMILIKTYIVQLPGELRDAAVIDGANDIAYFFKIVLHLIKPILATLGLFSAVGHWNSWTDTMIYNAARTDLFTMQYKLMMLLNQFGSNMSIEKVKELQRQGLMSVSPAGYRATMTFITILPILCAYPFLQKYFTKGLLIGSIKA